MDKFLTLILVPFLLGAFSGSIGRRLGFSVGEAILLSTGMVVIWYLIGSWIRGEK